MGRGRALLRLRAIGVSAALLLFTAACAQGGAGSAAHLPNSAANAVVGTNGTGGGSETVGGSGVSAGSGAGSSDSASGGGVQAPTDGSQGAVGRVVLRTYQDWWAAQVKAYAGNDPQGAQVRVYSADVALTNVLVSLRSLQGAKLVMTGQPVLNPVVKSLDLSGSIQTAVIQDCVDVSGWHQTDPSNGSLKDAPQHLTRYPATAVLRSSGALWKVFQFNRETGRTC
jgi:hypothetical protein